MISSVDLFLKANGNITLPAQSTVAWRCWLLFHYDVMMSAWYLFTAIRAAFWKPPRFYLKHGQAWPLRLHAPSVSQSFDPCLNAVVVPLKQQQGFYLWRIILWFQQTFTCSIVGIGTILWAESHILLFSFTFWRQTMAMAITAEDRFKVFMYCWGHVPWSPVEIKLLPLSHPHRSWIMTEFMEIMVPQHI